MDNILKQSLELKRNKTKGSNSSNHSSKRPLV